MCASSHFQNPRDKSSINYFAQQFNPWNTKSVINIYKSATRKPCSYLFVDLSQQTKDEHRLMGNIFFENGDEFVIYAPM